VHAYIIDTGIRTTHTDFGGRASVGVDEIGDGQNGQDCAGHGTHVAGTVGGATYGVAKNVQLVAVRVLDCSGSGTYSQVIARIDWVTQTPSSLPSRHEPRGSKSAALAA
jgi:subtilisin family serine protease